MESCKGYLGDGAIRSVERTEATLSELGACLAEEKMIDNLNKLLRTGMQLGIL